MENEEGKDISGIVRNFRNGNKAPFISHLMRKIYPSKSSKGKDVVDEEWDYLILLDACRYDTFEKINWLEGNLKKWQSKGSASIEFLKKNFSGNHEDIVYVSANPYVNTNFTEHRHWEGYDGSKHFHKVFPVFMNDENTYSDKKSVATPEKVTQKALEVKDRYPDKRIIVHYMQPHRPFIGEKQITEENKSYFQLRKQTSPVEIKQAYESNLKLALESIEDLVNEITGQIIISSDHGEALGSYGIWEHPHSVHIPDLVEVPALYIDKGERQNSVIGGLDV